MIRKHMQDHGVNEAAEDMKMKPMRYNQSPVESEAEEHKHGGRTKKHRKAHKHGGVVHHMHHKHGGHAGHHAEHEMHEGHEHHKHGGGTKHRAHKGKHHEHHAHGGAMKHHAGRKPRKSGGRLAGNEWAMAQTSHPAKGRDVSGSLS
jgi:hypothetical protein